jgi:hypothetical protein
VGEGYAGARELLFSAGILNTPPWHLYNYFIGVNRPYLGGTVPAEYPLDNVPLSHQELLSVLVQSDTYRSPTMPFKIYFDASKFQY